MLATATDAARRRLLNFEVDAHGQTVLHVAVKAGNVDIVKLLVQKVRLAPSVY